MNIKIGDKVIVHGPTGPISGVVIGTKLIYEILNYVIKLDLDSHVLALPPSEFTVW